MSTSDAMSNMWALQLQLVERPMQATTLEKSNNLIYL